MSIAELSSHTLVCKYARFKKELSRRTTFIEQVLDVLAMHKEKYKDKLTLLENDFNFLETVMLNKSILGSQRALQFTGEPILRKNARIYNCSASYCDRPEVFQEALWLLLCGVGVGMSVQKHHVAKLPSVSSVSPSVISYYKIPDTIEGWADALGVLLNSYFVNIENEFSQYSGTTVQFDYSQIRPKGSSIRGISGKAPGPEPLRLALEKIRQLLNTVTNNGETKLRPIVAYDIVMHSTEAVLSGGVRRSATLFLFSKDDNEMMKAKTGLWGDENPQRAMSNNSVVLLNDEISREEFREIFKNTKEFGEPGFAFLKNKEHLFNPCFEVLLDAIDHETGRTGWQMCNLTEINGKHCNSREEFLTLCKASAILGTLQAGYTDFEYLGEVSKRIVERDALLGCSITGFADNKEILFDAELQREGAELIKQVNADIAEKLGINKAARTTCVKPAGHTSALLETASGIHSHHSTRYIRHVKENKMSVTLNHFKKYNPLAIEEDGINDEVICFIVENDSSVLTKDNTSAIEFLEKVKLTQNNWVKYGTRHDPEKGTHNVSNTISIKDSEWDDVEEYLYNNRQYFTGVSLLSNTGDKDYYHAPFTSVFTKDEIMEMYGINEEDYSNLRDYIYFEIGTDISFKNLWHFSSEVLKATNNYDNDNLIIKKFYNTMQELKLTPKNLTYLLKDIFNWEKFNIIKSSYKTVDWTKMEESTDNTKHNEMYTCAGGACEIK